MKTRIPFILMLLLFSAGKAEVRSVEKFYVSPDGNDSWSGQVSDPNSKGSDGPLATLDAARLVVRKRLADGLSTPIEVQVRGGEYFLNETVVFGPEDSGTKGAPVTYMAYPGENPVFSGGRKIGEWARCHDEPEGISAQAKGNLWFAEVPDSKKSDWKIKTLYDGENLLKRSISQEFVVSDVELPEDYNAQIKTLMRMLKPEDSPVGPFLREIHFRGEDLKDWKNVQDIEIFWRPKRNWLVNMLPLDRIDTDKKTAWFSVDPTYRYKAGNTYQVENALEYLDEPGEWVFNSLEGRIYFWPETPLKDSDIRAPYLQEFIRVEGIEDGAKARFINFEGLSFRHGLRDTWAEGDKALQHDWEMFDKGNAIMRFRHAEDSSVSGCIFSSSSGGGVRLDLYCQRITVADNHLKYLGGSGIVLSGYGPGTKDENKYNVVTNNYIHNIGEIYWHCPGIFIAQSGHNKITHNTIHDLGYNGLVVSGCRPHEFVLHNVVPHRRAWVSSIRVDECLPYIEEAKKLKKLSIDPFLPLLHARENDISMNEIYRIMLRLHDGNALYFSAMGSNNRVERNFCHDNWEVAGTIRLDDNPSYTFLNYNVIMHSERGFGIKGPCELNNNFVIDVDLFMRGRVKFRYTMDNQNNLFFPPVKGSRLGGYYLSDKEEGVKNMPFHEKIRGIKDSLFFTRNPDKAFLPTEELGTDLVTGKKAKPGKGDIGLLYADPLLDEEAMKEKHFKFKKGSPATKLGIEPIDLREVGSTLARRN